MKIEDLQYDLSSGTAVDENNWNREQWIKEYPIDYFKMLFFLCQSEDGAAQTELFKTLYQIIRLYIPDSLFKYYSLSADDELNNKKFETLENRKIYLSDIGSFNDPFDSKAFYYDANQLSAIDRLKHVGGRLIDDFTAFIRSTSLTANGVQSMPMWAHYSNNHVGFCVSYDMKSNVQLSGCTFPVQYTDERLDITSLMYSTVQKICEMADHNIELGIKETLVKDLRIIYASLLLSNVKHSSWNYEKEFRCTIASNAEGVPFIEANPKEIYIGMSCSNDNAKRLIAIGKQLKVPVYKMAFEECNPKYILSANRLV